MSTEQHLKKLAMLHGCPGHEDEVAGYVEGVLREVCEDARRDVLGNVFGVRGEGDTRIMVAAHMDRIGLMVKGITDEGYLRIAPLGGVPAISLVSQRVVVHVKGKTIHGVIGVPPPHLSKKEKKLPEVKALLVDIGVSSREEAVEMGVEVGTPIGYVPHFTHLGENRVAAVGMDNRAGVAAMLDMAERYEGRATVYFVATVQEEVGLIGARTSAFRVNPDYALVMDATHGTMPGVEEQDVPVKLGEGVAIGVGPFLNPALARKSVELAREREIKHQIEPNPSRTGTDTDVILTTRTGVATALYSVPVRYMHSPVEVVDLRDLRATADLGVAFLESF